MSPTKQPPETGCHSCHSTLFAKAKSKNSSDSYCIFRERLSEKEKSDFNHPVSIQWLNDKH